jgi:hypothetical protein
MTQQKLIQEWLKNLRSGKYKQGQLYLNVNDQYHCCLGVLCETYIEQGGKLAKDGHPGGVCRYDEEYTTNLPSVINDFLDFTIPFTETLMEMNDSQAKNFNEIADYIECTLKNRLSQT